MNWMEYADEATIRVAVALGIPQVEFYLALAAARDVLRKET